MAPDHQLQISVGPDLNRNLTSVQYVGTYADPTATATYGNRYVFGNLDQWTLSGNIRLNWIFTPRLSLELFMQPFVSTGNYRVLGGTGGAAHLRLHRVRAGQWLDLRPRTPGSPIPTDRAARPHRLTSAIPNFQFGSHTRQRRAAVGMVPRINAVRRLDSQPGQFTNTLTDSEFNPGQSFDTILQAPADNVLLVKFTWWLNP